MSHECTRVSADCVGMGRTLQAVAISHDRMKARRLCVGWAATPSGQPVPSAGQQRQRQRLGRFSQGRRSQSDEDGPDDVHQAWRSERLKVWQCNNHLPALAVTGAAARMH
eukprot:CAMPEP_0119109162 /NCGR_PEP_ID=MMETSP1180-20130426/17490_1 /TAXON_ID=3052 ORGANISM="Chlamydomonas cf sp, Strain CCMP681" /NCGR_SAMPLE_ID=MMETSP1180 /ASSEMBLY_ACC=CAM_ASM_000741 /LENGTH=109 /DNA_ID=CAMNT_0007094879 /DNA_START=62 /DNA_END=392 /DNA_ORIENTATION=-